MKNYLLKKQKKTENSKNTNKKMEEISLPFACMPLQFDYIQKLL